MPRRSTETARNLLEVTTLLMRRFAAEIRHGEGRLTPVQIGILARIHEGPCDLTELSRHLAVRLPTASQSVSLLVERGWVDRWRPSDDRRRTLFRLTASGRRAFATKKRKAERFVGGILEPLSASEHTQVNASLALLRRTLESAEPGS